VVHQERGGDPGAVVFDGLAAADARGSDVVIIDTAGRLHTQVNLMNELAKVRRVIEKRTPGAPHETLVCIDATTGQNGLIQARMFKEAADLTGVVVTKMDGTAKGGIALAISHELELPIKLIGTGERMDSLQPFDATSFAEMLFDEELVRP
jgi:fused signal recognition particle receptor